MRQIPLKLFLALQLIKKQKLEIKRLKAQIESLTRIDALKMYNDVVRGKSFYDTVLNPQIELSGSHEGYSDIYVTNARNILCFTSDYTNKRSFLCKTVLINPVQSRRHSLPQTNLVMHRIKLSKQMEKLDKAQFFIAKVSSKMYVNVEFYDLFNLNGKTYLKANVQNIDPSYNKIPIDKKQCNSFSIIKERNTRLMNE